MKLSESELIKLAKPRKHMINIFQTIEKVYDRFIQYNTYIVCLDINYFEFYQTTEPKKDMIYITKNDNINEKIFENGYNKDDNIIFSFFVME